MPVATDNRPLIFAHGGKTKGLHRNAVAVRF